MSRIYAIAFLVSAALVLPNTFAMAQNGQPPQVSMVTLQVVQNSDGTQSVITPKGDLAQLPGAGVNGNVAEIYMGSQGGFWYTDRTGKTIDLNSAVQSLQARRAQTQQAAQVPQYAPEPYVQEQGSSGASALGTAAAAGVGAAVGAAMSNHYYNAPYGTPMYYGPGSRPYYYGQGNRPVEELNDEQKQALSNKHQQNQQAKQQALQQGQANSQARQDQRSTNPQSRQQAYAHGQAGGHSQAPPQQFAGARADAGNFQKQQQWYQDQRRDNPNKFQKSGDNPFVAQQGRGDRESARSHSGREGRSASAGRGGGGGGRSGGARGGGGRRGR